RWSFYDDVVRAVAEELKATPAEKRLRDWLLSLLPGPHDVDHVGYGPWFRVADQEMIERFLDLRELTVENQQLFHQASKRAGARARSDDRAEWLRNALVDLADMAERADRGEPPLSRSDWREVIASQGRQVGPGWGTA